MYPKYSFFFESSVNQHFVLHISMQTNNKNLISFRNRPSSLLEYFCPLISAPWLCFKQNEDLLSLVYQPQSHTAMSVYTNLNSWSLCFQKIKHSSQQAPAMYFGSFQQVLQIKPKSNIMTTLVVHNVGADRVLHCYFVIFQLF